MGVAGLMTLGGQNRQLALGTLVYEGVKLQNGRRWFEPVLDVLYIQVHPFSAFSPQFLFCFAPLQLSNQKKSYS
jgi:hypothetical protein